LITMSTANAATWLTWAPLMRAARAEAESDLAGFSVAIQRNGCDAAQARMSELEDDMQPLAEEIIEAPATSLGGLRAKALVALWEALPASAFHHGAFEFRDDGEASRSLFDAVARAHHCSVRHAARFSAPKRT
jgi:hypothetical protein